MEESSVQKQELITAVEEGNVEEVRSLINNLDSFALSSWKHGFNLLCQALRNKQYKIAKILINHGCSLQGEYGDDTALHVAVVHGNVELVNMIRDKGWSTRARNAKGMAALHVFTQRHPVNDEAARVLKYLLQSSSEINLKHNESGFTPIHFAAECGNAEMISLLLKMRAQLNGTEDNDRTPLHIAALNGRNRAVSTLLQHGANMNLLDSRKKTPLCLAVEKRDLATIDAFLNTLKIIYSDEMLMHCAIETMDKTIIEKLLKKRANPNNPSHSGKFPIHRAVEEGSQEIVSLLLHYSAFPDAAQIRISNSKQFEASIGFTALHFAAEKEDVEIFRILLENGANPGIVDGKGQTPLHLATKNGSLPIISSLLTRVYDIPSLFTSEISKGYTPLHIAVENGNEDFVTLFLNVGIPVNSPTKAGFMPLHLAAQKGDTRIVKLLLKYDADPSAQGSSSIETPLFLAAEAGNSEVVNILSEVSTNRTGKWQEGYLSLFIAAFHGHEGVVKILLDKGVNPNANFGKFLTPLYVAAQQGHESIVNILLERGAEVNPNREADRFLTPLVAACRSGHESIVEILLNLGADINVRVTSIPKQLETKFESKFDCLLIYGCYSLLEFTVRGFDPGFMPIHFAAAVGNKSIVEMLLKRGADVDSKDENNSTPLCVAVKNQHEEVVACLLEFGASPDVKVSGQFVLLKAILLKNAKIVDLLLKFNAPWKFTCRFKKVNGFTPLHLAVMESTAEIVEALLRRGSVDIDPNVELPLHCAVERNDSKIISKLVEYGACVDSICSEGLTPLLHAIESKKTKALKLLLKLGASLKIKTAKGASLLHFALDEEVEVEMINLIVKCGADVNARNSSNLSAIERVIKEKFTDEDDYYFYKHYDEEEEEEDDFRMPYDHNQLLWIFLKEGFDVNTQMILMGTGESVLHYACRTQNTNTVRLLLQNNADVNAVDRKGHTPFYYAIQEASLSEEELCNEIGDYVGSEDDEENPVIHDLDKSSDNYSDDSYFYMSGAEKMIERRDDYKNLARLMTQAVARVEASGEDLASENVVLFTDNFVKRYYSRCKSEIEELKQKKITKYISCFDILIASDKRLAELANNTSIVEAFDSSNFKSEFPLYGEDLIVRFERGVDRMKLMEMSVDVLNEVLGIKLPDLVVDKIFQHLRSVDLKNLCRARNPIFFI